MKRNQIVTLKVRRDKAGRTVPFDKLYFFRRKDRGLIPKFFDFALVLPIDEDLKQQIIQLIPKEVSHHKFVRDDDSLHHPTMLDGRSNSQEEVQQWWEENFFKKFHMDKRVAVVPILVSKRRKKAFPRYITSTRWFNMQRVKENFSDKKGSLPVANNLQQGVHELAYLSTPLPAPHDKIQPICNICPRQMLQLNGECVPGMPVCYKTLDLNQILADDEKPGND